jgi:hypothetical protein
MEADVRGLGAISATSWSAVVALFCVDEGVRLRVHRLLRRHVDVVEVRTPPALVRVASEASCTVLVVGRESPDYAAAVRRSQAHHPLVIVKADERSDAYGFGRSPYDEIVLLRDLDQELSRAVSRACLSGLLGQMASAVEADKRVPPMLRAALALAYRARPPLRAVKELAAQVGCQPRTLEHHWRTAVPGTGGFRLHDLLNWILLLHATTGRLTAASWTAVAAELGVCCQTLARLGRTLADLSLREIAALGHRGTFPLFKTRVVPALAPRATLRVLT